MENETTEELNIIKKISNIVIKKKKLFLSLAFIIIAILSLIVFLNYYQTTQNNKISEKYVKAGIYLSSKDNEKSKSIYSLCTNQKKLEETTVHDFMGMLVKI